MRPLSTLLAALLLAAGPAAARAAEPAPPAAQQVPPAQPAPLTDERLDQLLAPVALYPDALLAQVLMATTYPDQVVQAAGWSKAHPQAKGDQAVSKAASQQWDPSVQSLVAFPQVLATLQQKPEWVREVGEAFLAQPDKVMDSVQRLRQLAQQSGNLQSNEQQQVTTEQLGEASAIAIAPAEEGLVYVPSYDPTLVYGTWPYPSYPPYYLPAPLGYGIAAGVTAGVAFGVGVAARNALWGGWNWGRRDVDINVNRYNRINAGRPLRTDQASWTRMNQDRIASARARTPYRGSATASGAGAYGADRAAQRANAQQRVQQHSPGAYQGSAQQRAQSVDRGQAQQRAQSARSSGQGRSSGMSRGGGSRGGGRGGGGRGR